MIVYDRPLAYDIAFGFRDVVSEVDCLVAWFERATGRFPASVLELACGPAAHAIEFASRGAVVSALDLSGAMCDYARQKAALAGVTLDLHQGDMVDFGLERRYELIATLSNSIAHVHTLDDLLAHLTTVARHLAQDGLYVLQVQHPRTFLGRAARPGAPFEPWTIAGWGLEVETRWGSPGDPYDPAAQIFEATVEMKIRDGQSEQTFAEVVRMRDWTLTELIAALRLCGQLECVEVHGDLAPDAPFDRESAWMVLLCRRSDRQGIDPEER